MFKILKFDGLLLCMRLLHCRFNWESMPLVWQLLVEPQVLTGVIEQNKGLPDGPHCSDPYTKVSISPTCNLIYFKAVENPICAV
jgi:hypothetical protein